MKIQYTEIQTKRETGRYFLKEASNVQSCKPHLQNQCQKDVRSNLKKTREKDCSKFEKVLFVSLFVLEKYMMKFSFLFNGDFTV